MPIELYIKNAQTNHFACPKMRYFRTGTFLQACTSFSHAHIRNASQSLGKSLHSSPRDLPFFNKEFEKSSLPLQDTKPTEIAGYFMG